MRVGQMIFQFFRDSSRWSASNFPSLTAIYVWVCIFVLPMGSLAGVDTVRSVGSGVFFLFVLNAGLRSGLKALPLTFLCIDLVAAMAVGLGRQNLDDGLKVARLFLGFYVIFLIAENRANIRRIMRFQNIIAWLTAALLFGQLVFCRFEGPFSALGIHMSGQATLYNLDPNYSGFVLLMFLFVTVALNQKWLSAMVVIATVFVASRNLLIGIIAFFLAYILLLAIARPRQISTDRTRRKLSLTFLLVVMTSTVIVYGMSTSYEDLRASLRKQPFFKSYEEYSSRNIDHRFFSLIDQSNSVRFTINRAFFERCRSEGFLPAFGFPDYPPQDGPTLHNMIFDLTARFGWICAALFICCMTLELWLLPFATYFIVPVCSFLIFGQFLAGILDSKTWILICLSALFAEFVRVGSGKHPKV